MDVAHFAGLSLEVNRYIWIVRSANSPVMKDFADAGRVMPDGRAIAVLRVLLVIPVLLSVGSLPLGRTAAAGASRGGA